MKNKLILAVLLAASVLGACGGPEVVYRPDPLLQVLGAGCDLAAAELETYVEQELAKEGLTWVWPAGTSDVLRDACKRGVAAGLQAIFPPPKPPAPDASPETDAAAAESDQVRERRLVQPAASSSIPSRWMTSCGSETRSARSTVSGVAGSLSNEGSRSMRLQCSRLTPTIAAMTACVLAPLSARRASGDGDGSLILGRPSPRAIGAPSHSRGSAPTTAQAVADTAARPVSMKDQCDRLQPARWAASA